MMSVNRERSVHVVACIVNILPAIHFWSSGKNILVGILFIPLFFLFTIIFFSNPPRVIRTLSPIASLILILLMLLLSFSQYNLTVEYSLADYTALVSYVPWSTWILIKGAHSLIEYFFLLGIFVHALGFINPSWVKEEGAPHWIKVRRYFLAVFYTVMLGFMLYALAQTEDWGIGGYIGSLLFIVLAIFPLWHLTITGYFPEKTAGQLLLRLLGKLRR